MENQVSDSIKAHGAEPLRFLRFLAFALIFLHHTDDYQLAWFPGSSGAMCAVDFFIILSGMVSTFSFNGKDIKCSFGSIFRYMRNKIYKLYPLYFVTTVFAIIFSPIPRMISENSYEGFNQQLIQFLKCLFMVQAWTDDCFYAFNGVGWFVSLIMFLYLITIPLNSLICRLCKSKHKIFLLSVITVISFLLTCEYNFITKDSNTEFTQ